MADIMKEGCQYDLFFIAFLLRQFRCLAHMLQLGYRLTYIIGIAIFRIQLKNFIYCLFCLLSFHSYYLNTVSIGSFTGWAGLKSYPSNLAIVVAIWRW